MLEFRGQSRAAVKNLVTEEPPATHTQGWSHSLAQHLKLADPLSQEWCPGCEILRIKPDLSHQGLCSWGACPGQKNYGPCGSNCPSCPAPGPDVYDAEQVTGGFVAGKGPARCHMGLPVLFWANGWAPVLLWGEFGLRDDTRIQSLNLGSCHCGLGGSLSPGGARIDVH